MGRGQGDDQKNIVLMTSGDTGASYFLDAVADVWIGCNIVPCDMAGHTMRPAPCPDAVVIDAGGAAFDDVATIIDMIERVKGGAGKIVVVIKRRSHDLCSLFMAAGADAVLCSYEDICTFMDGFAA